jgi:hypothetical protein
VVYVRTLAATAALIAIYAGINIHFYGLPVPVSGMAKNGLSLTIHTQTFKSLVSNSRPTSMMLWALLLTGLMLYLAPQRRALTVLSGLSVLLFYTLNALRSDYQIWPWYLYPFVLHAIVVFLHPVDTARSVKREYAWLVAIATLALATVSITKQAYILYTHRTQDNGIVDTAKFVKATLAGMNVQRIAMGDRAGAVGYLVGKDVVQLEGLVMDKGYLSFLKGPFDFGAVLAKYKPDVYVATDPERIPGTNCYFTTEPLQAGDRATRNKLCAPVLASRQSTPGNNLTVIFDLRSARQQ